MSASPQIGIVCCATEPSAAERDLLAALPAILMNADATTPLTCDFYLRFETRGLTLSLNEPSAPGGLCIDFGAPDLTRRTRDSLKQQNLCKAVGLKGSQPLRILDATAGLGKDAWLLASAGATVLMLERSSVVFALLQDGIARGRARGAAKSSILERMQLQHTDFLHTGESLPKFDVVYLDPMFPPTSKTARAKKDMYLLQRLLGENSCDELSLLAKARAMAQKRIVVKRAKLSPYLARVKPDIEFKGSGNRFDVYMNTALNEAGS